MFCRELESVLRKWFFRGKVLVVTGARQVGKSTLMEGLLAGANVRSLVLNADEATIRKTLRAADTEKLKNLVGNNRIVVIDEVQRIENPGLLLKMLHDNFRKVQFLATGSSALDIADKVFEPLTGRHFLFHLYPFTLRELYPGESEYAVSRQLPFHLVFGAYPDVCNNRGDAAMYLRNLANQYLYRDVLAWKDIRKPDLLDRLLLLLAGQVCSEISLHEIGRQLNLKTETVENYIDLLEKAFIVFRLRSYATNHRKEVSKMKKVYFWDNGIRNAILGDFSDLEKRADAGLLWENLMVAERMKMNHYRQKDAKPFFWRSLQQQEVDYVETSGKSLTGFEMKYNSHKRNYVTRAFTNLYPKAKTALVEPDNFAEFCYLH